MKECTMCAAPIPSGAATCPECGEYVVPPSEPPPPPIGVSGGSRGRGMWMLLLAAALAVVGFVLALTFQAEKKQESFDTPETFRAARQALEKRWAASRDSYFNLLAQTDLIAEEDMERREIQARPGAWSALDENTRRLATELIALRVSIRRGDPRVEHLRILEGETLLATYSPGEGVKLH